MVTFLRREAKKFSKFGKRRKKLLSWRKPKGRDNKMREKRRGYGPSVSIGYKQSEESRKGSFVLINNLGDLKKIGKKDLGFLGKVGKKKKLEILTEAKKMNVKLKNFNVETFLKKEEKKKSMKTKIEKSKDKKIEENKEKQNELKK